MAAYPNHPALTVIPRYTVIQRPSTLERPVTITGVRNRDFMADKYLSLTVLPAVEAEPHQAAPRSWHGLNVAELPPPPVLVDFSSAEPEGPQGEYDPNSGLASLSVPF